MGQSDSSTRPGNTVHAVAHKSERRTETASLLAHGEWRRTEKIAMRKLLVVCVLVALLRLVPADNGDDKDDVGTVVGIDLGTTYSW